MNVNCFGTNADKSRPDRPVLMLTKSQQQGIWCCGVVLVNSSLQIIITDRMLCVVTRQKSSKNLFSIERVNVISRTKFIADVFVTSLCAIHRSVCNYTF